ncbi:MAG: DUF2784 family protein [Bacteroidota bacterium]
MLYSWLDTFFWGLHIFIIGFNMGGWVLNSTRRLHLIIVLLTLASWFILGFWYGFGYCFLTDWHWEIKRELGESNLPNSFITYLVNYQLGYTFSVTTIDTATAITFAIILILSFYKNRNFIKKWCC